MRFCQECGKEINESSKFCQFCGKAVSFQCLARQTIIYPQQAVVRAIDSPNAGFAFLCFLFPIAGLILYLVWKEQYPMKAKSCGKGALVSVCIAFVFLLFAAVSVFGMNFWFKHLHYGFY